jgi:type VI secretion system protein
VVPAGRWDDPMGLKLTIVSEHREILGPRASIVLGNAGGSIGRARDNDWVLADPNCYLSAHHARVQCRLGSYYLLDTSTNGVYVNGGMVPIGRRNIYPLRDGDRLRLGDYLIDVSIDVESEAAAAAEASAIFSVNTELQRAAPEASDPDIGAVLDVKELLRQAAPSTTGLRAVDVFGQPALTQETDLLTRERVGHESTAAPTRTRLETRPAPSPHATRADPQPASATRSRPISEATAIDALCRGAGIDAGLLPSDTPAQLLHRAGLLLREALGGLKAVALAQRELRDQSRLKLEQDTQLPDMAALSVEELLVQLLAAGSQTVDAVQWLRDSAGSMREQELAFMRAMRSALSEFVARLDPRSLAQSSAERSETEHASSGLTARFRSITENPSGAFPQLFVEALARAFAAECAHNSQGRTDD